jgi:hypothetical protein
VYELTVDLDVVELKTLQQRKVAVFGAEVINGELDALASQLRQMIAHIVDAREQPSFGNFEDDLQSGPTGREDVAQIARKLSQTGVESRQVDGDAEPVR